MHGEATNQSTGRRPKTGAAVGKDPVKAPWFSSFHRAATGRIRRLMGSPIRTALYATHLRLGARMTVFAGFAMPVSYSGIIEEHRAVRTAAGLFDLSHMGEFEISGPHALELLERALTNSAARLAQNRAQYTLMCAEDGGIIDDLIVYRIGAERYLLCVNASNLATDREWLAALNSARTDRAEFRDLSDATALVAVQGPNAAQMLAALASFAIEKVPYFGLAEGKIADIACLAARTGYTGEDGFELFVAAPLAERLFEVLLEKGAPSGVRPCGLGARDTLRLEAALPLYGHELDRATSPLEAGLGGFVKFGRGFIGEAALLAQQKNGPAKRLVGLLTDDGRTVARQNYRILSGGRDIGKVTSGTFAPTLKRPIAMGYIGAAEPHAPGAKIEVEVRGKAVPATITALPFYRRPRRTA